MKTFLILAYDAGHIHLFRIQASQQVIAEHRFLNEADKNDWTPFERIIFHEVSGLVNEDVQKGKEILKIGVIPGQLAATQEEQKCRITQPYGFRNDDYGKAYAEARKFTAKLHDAGIEVSLPDGLRDDTKNYLDYGSSVTTITVFPDLYTTEELKQAEKIYTDLVDAPVEVPAAILEARKLIEGKGMVLTFAEGEGWMLRRTDCVPQEVDFWGAQTEEVLNRVKRHLGLEVAPIDDYDPFLDTDDLP